VAFDSPGRADPLPTALLRAWNETIASNYERQRPSWGSRFFALDPATLTSPTPATVKWFGDPAEPVFCRSLDVARGLADWAPKGRRVLHNEYCEYAVVFGSDGGRPRPKRVEVTTELREYWVCVARNDPAELRKMARRVLNRVPRYADLYGVDDPLSLSRAERETRFVAHLAPEDGEAAGRLNTDRALFMNHPINGLDDLIYIVMFGAHPYAVRQGAGVRPATRDEIFKSQGVEHLACRHADPAAALGAHGAAFAGRRVAFADPLGMYILSFSSNLFTYQGNAVPKRWVRWGRGRRGMYQRLVFGPDDGDDAFLDDIRVSTGAADEPVTGGFQVVQQVEVGPLLLVGSPTTVRTDEYRLVPRTTAAIRCAQARVCEDVRRLEREYDAAHAPGTVRVGPRVMGPNP
jgi:hypothetical protein